MYSPMWLEHHEKLKRLEYRHFTRLMIVCDLFVVETFGCVSPYRLALLLLLLLCHQGAGLRTLEWRAPWNNAGHAPRCRFLVPLSMGLHKMWWHARTACLGHAEHAELAEPDAAAS